MHALVGANNSGKSTVLHALDFLFNPSVRKLSEESFYRKDINRRIEVEGVFTELTEEEKNSLGAYLRPDGAFHVMRTAQYLSESDEDGDADASETKIKIVAHYANKQPSIDWLNPSKISGAAIQGWLANKDTLVHKGHSFMDELVGIAKPAVGVWKEKAEAFATARLSPDEFEDSWIPNPQGYAGVLKATLPHFEMIPAVRDAIDESKVTKTNPFGRLIYEIVKSLDADLREELDTALKQTVLRLNRSDAGNRAVKVSEIENTIKGFLSELMPVDIELEFQAPTVEVLLTTPKIVVDDGFKGSVDGKGHGLQRAVIFSILRAYSKLVTERPDAAKRTLVLGVEEPELYMHPTAQRMIRRVLRTIANGGDQVFITTHSPLMVDVAYFDEIVRMEPVNAAGECPVPYQLFPEQLIENLEISFPNLKGKITTDSIREKYRHAYTASRNEGFFARIVVLVEGQTEAYALPVYSLAAGSDFDSLGIAVVECGGKGQLDRLYRIFNELGIACYVLFDYDLGNADKGVRRDTDGLLALLNGADIKDPEIAHVGDEFSCFSKDWESDMAPHIEDYVALKSAAKSNLGLKDESKPLVARYVALQLADRDPPVIPEVIRQILEKVVVARRVRSCLRKEAVA